ncbi:VOC family protein [Thorsellia anophelis]|uniref:Glyoxalase-like domain-containing protein n=1 Tax=Thorsellia anophelis DSM 18579 TaxID=1123402 RepID=A0A1H9YTM9_9GAMM|nr:VOC family protein [Thorsellia anophelis]SES72484.1 Glyoxalase-like domain-containing protein [Thorsellia anophelis DSM 18579]
MIKFHQIMLYVENQEKIAQFWVEHLNFVIKQNNNDSGVPIIVISDGRENGTEIVLHDKNLIARYQPELNLGTPSILLSTTQDIDTLYKQFKSKKITVGELMTLPTGQQVFNFADPENNYFAIIQAR